MFPLKLLNHVGVFGYMRNIHFLGYTSVCECTPKKCSEIILLLILQVSVIGMEGGRSIRGIEK